MEYRYSRTAMQVTCGESVGEFNSPATTYPVDAIRLAINTPAVVTWQEFDAVGVFTNLPANAKKTAKSGGGKNGNRQNADRYGVRRGL